MVAGAGSDPRGRGTGRSGSTAADVVPAAPRFRPGRSGHRRRTRIAHRIGTAGRMGTAGGRRRQPARRTGSRRRSRCRGRTGGCRGHAEWRSSRCSFGLRRRRDVFDGCTVGATAASRQRHETSRRHACVSGLADRPSGRTAACRAVDACMLRRAPASTAQAWIRTLAGPNRSVGRVSVRSRRCRCPRTCGTSFLKPRRPSRGDHRRDHPRAALLHVTLDTSGGTSARLDRHIRRFWRRPA